eukprot:13736172-Alexandrium_andersonii.AAC.1
MEAPDDAAEAAGAGACDPSAAATASGSDRDEPRFPPPSGPVSVAPGCPARGNPDLGCAFR